MKDGGVIGSLEGESKSNELDGLEKETNLTRIGY